MTWPALLAAGPSVTVPVGKVPTPLPVPKVIVGNDVYPLPPFVTVAELKSFPTTALGVTTQLAVRALGLPPPAVVGALV
ncbi:MAG: hypothetical protein DMG18_10595 [Acidobacteria bacterium]|nr:MAG: hypothetical protein DMG18_10595 [Acidobacteriota bacterium]